MFYSAISALFEYLCYGSTTIIKKIFLLLQCEDRLWSSESDVYRRQILTSKVDHRAVKDETVTQGWVNVGPVSSTVEQHWPNSESVND